jgi:nitroreductase
MSNTVLSPEAAVHQLLWRYAVKKFDPARKISDEDWKALEQSLVLSPSSFGLQPWKFFVVQNPEIRSQLLEHSWKQPQIVDASHLVVLAIKKDMGEGDVDRYVARQADVHSTTVESLAGYTGMMKGFMARNPNVNEWSARQVYIALGQYIATAAMIGIDTCPIEGFSPEKYDEILGLTAMGYAACVVCPAGYRSEEDKYAVLPKVRFATEEVVAYI